MTLEDLYQQFLGVMPAGDAMLDMPTPAASPMTPAFPPWAAGGMMPSFPTLGGEPPESAQVDPMLGVTNAFGAGTTAPAQYGYSPQPRPMLPAPIAADAQGLYGPFRGIWEGAQEEEDPLAAMLAQLRPAAPAAMEPRTPALPYEPARGFGQPPVPQPSRNERLLGQQRPRVMDRINWLRGLRAQRGY